MRFIIDVVATGEEAHQIRRAKGPENLGQVKSRNFMIRDRAGNLDIGWLNLAALTDVPEWAVLEVTACPTEGQESTR